VKRGKEGKICGADDGDDNNGDDNDGENDDKKNNSKSTFCPPQSRKRHQNLFRMHPGSNAALLVPWCAHCNRVETGINY
jgi:hypothetical protein